MSVTRTGPPALEATPRPAAGPIPPLAVREYGRGGRPLVLLHGLSASSATWAPVADRLAPLRRVLAPDLLGFGHSPWPDVAYTVDDHLAAVERTLEACGLGAGTFDLVGHSMGAVLAAELAARRPERVNRLALVSLPYFRSDEEARAWLGGLGILARSALAGHWLAGALCGVMCALRPALRVALPWAAHFAPHLPTEVLRDSVLHNYASYSRSLGNLIVRHRLDCALARLATRPVHLLHGDRDRTAPLGNVRLLAERFPGWRLEVLAGAGHYPPFEQPEQVAAWLEAATVGSPLATTC